MLRVIFGATEILSRLTFFSSILQSALVIAAILRSVINDYIVICRSRDDRGYLIPSHSAKVLK